WCPRRIAAPSSGDGQRLPETQAASAPDRRHRERAPRPHHHSDHYADARFRRQSRIRAQLQASLPSRARAEAPRRRGGARGFWKEATQGVTVPRTGVALRSGRRRALFWILGADVGCPVGRIVEEPLEIERGGVVDGETGGAAEKGHQVLELPL